MKNIISCEKEQPQKVLNRLTVDAYRKGLKIKTEKLIAYNTKKQTMEILFKINYLKKD